MMKCEIVQNRLLGLLDLTVVPDDLCAHLGECELCSRFVDRVHLLNNELAELPAPSSEEAKFAFLASVRGFGPVIQSLPSTATGGATFRELFSKIPIRPALSTAAAVLVGVGIWAAWPKQQAVVAKADPPRHKLLAKMPGYIQDLATAQSPQARIAKLANLATDLRSETESLAKVAQPDEMLSLARMYDNVVNKGIVANAELMTPHNSTAAERQAALTTTANELSDTATAFGKLVPNASQQLQPILQRIAKTARDGELRLKKLAEGV